MDQQMDQLRAGLLVVSQLFFTLVGSVANIVLGITLRDLHNSSCGTYYVLLANVTMSNVLVCTFVKTILSIYVSYAFLKDQYEVDLQFCPVYTVLYWTTVPILPATLFVISWHLFLGSRRADERARKIPKHALSIFLMMIPLATAIFESTKRPKKYSQSELMRLTDEQKRKLVKSVTMKDGPRPRQIVMVALIWMFSTFLGLERILHLQTQEKGSLSREYIVQPWDNSSREITVIKDEDTIYCTVFSHPDSLHGFIVWVMFVLTPVLLGPVFTSFMEIFHYVSKQCSTTPSPPTPSQFRSWISIHLISIVTMTTYTLHLWLVETSLNHQLGLDFFSSLLLKYFVGNLDIIIVPLIPLFIEPKLKEGLSYRFTAKKKGILSKNNSVYSEYM